MASSLSSVNIDVVALPIPSSVLKHGRADILQINKQDVVALPIPSSVLKLVDALQVKYIILPL